MIHRSKPSRSLLAVLLVTTMLAGRAPAAEVAPAEGPIAYSVDFEGAPGGRVESLLRESSQLVRLRDNPPMTLAALSRRIERDEQRFRAALESEGYYSATVVTSTKDEKGRVVVTVTVDPGPRYAMTSVMFDLAREEPATVGLIKPQDYETPLKDIVGRPARAADVILAEDTALGLLRAKGFPFARRGDRQVDVDHETRTVAVNLPVELDHQAFFGATHFSGLERVNEAHLQRLVPWPRGEIFNLSALDKFREELILASLFTSVRVEPAADSVSENGSPLDVNVTVAEGPHRSIGTGLTYARDKGVGASAYWRHRNLFGNGERFEASLDGTQLDQTAEVSLEKPGFLSRQNTLKLGATGHHEDTDAFREYSGILRGSIERKLNDVWRIAGGTTFEFAVLTEDGVERRSYLAGLPLGISRAVDERLVVEMTRGWRLRVNAVPYVGRYVDTATFVHLETEVDGYYPVMRGDRLVLAGRLKVGSLLGEHTDNIPANKRFYAGGGGSIRGFGYQLVGPLDAENKPMGGRGLIETSAEARIRVTRTIGIVPFIDAGMVSRAGLPGQDGDIRIGAGIGARYYTGAGPLRVDFAIPLNRRAGVDKSFQFYVSFGQAF
jgi:translocation and assembly module TamA